jgi:phosphatidylglycerol:prolipoprotein diacylglycerol transferase
MLNDPVAARPREPRRKDGAEGNKLIEINIDPVLHLGGLGIRWITVSFIVAILITIATGIIGIKRIGIPLVPKNIVGMSLSILICSLIGTRLFYVMDNWSYYLGHPDQVISLDGIVIYGIVLGIVAGIAIYARIAKLPFWRWGDGIAPGAMLGMALYRIGCIINGCCYGITTNLPWAVVFTNPESLAPFGKLLHPTQVYHLVLGLMVFATVWTVQRRLKPEGSIFLLWLVLFAATDLPVRFFRVEAPFLLGMKLAVIVDILILVITVPWLILRKRTARNTDTTMPFHR